MDSQMIEKRESALLDAVKIAFSFFDKQGKGAILPEQIADLDEEHKACNNKFPRFVDYEADDCIEEFKKFDADGGVDLGEYYELVTEMIRDQKLMEDAVDDAFLVFDRRHLGLINADDFKAAMEIMGEKLTDAQLKDMMDKACHSNDKEISKEDFVNETQFRQMNLDSGRRRK